MRRLTLRDSDNLVYLGSDPENLGNVRFTICESETGKLVHGQIPATKLVAFLHDNGKEIATRTIGGPAQLRTGTGG